MKYLSRNFWLSENVACDGESFRDDVRLRCVATRLIADPTEPTLIPRTTITQSWQLQSEYLTSRLESLIETVS